MSKFISGLYRFSYLFENKHIRDDSERRFELTAHCGTKVQLNAFESGSLAAFEKALGQGWQWKEYSWERVSQ